MSDSGDNVTDDTKREEQEEEDRRKQKEKEEREEKERKQKEKEEKERKQKEQDEERQRKEKEENERKEQEDSKRQEEEADREYDTASEEGRSKQREFFKAELLRLQRSLRDESSKISKPKQRSYYPFVWTSLEPYYNTYVANYLIDLCDEVGRPKGKSPEDEQARPVSRGKSYAEDPRPGYVSRNTAIGLCDPWTDLRMDRELLPRLATPASKSRKRAEQGKRTKGKKERPPKEGSTRLPKFPVVDFNTNKENATKQFLYSEVPKFRQEMAGRYSQKAPKKIETDYTRTRQDFYRMNLDKLDEIHPKNRPHMRQAYFAYLQNTPGSKKAIKECVKTLDDEPPAQKAN